MPVIRKMTLATAPRSRLIAVVDDLPPLPGVTSAELEVIERLGAVLDTLLVVAAPVTNTEKSVPAEADR
jgi:hypothetical protein